MKRYLLTLKDNKQIKLYSNTAIFDSWNPTFVEDITEETHEYTKDMVYKIQHFPSVKLIEETPVRLDNTVEHIFEMKSKLINGKILFKLMFDNDDDSYFDIARAKVINDTKITRGILWEVIDLKKLFDLMTLHSDCPISYEVLSHRYYGEPKLTKPPMLKGIKAAFSVDFVPKKCKIEIFIKDNDIYYKHRDYFSSIWLPPENEKTGMPTAYYLKKYFNQDKKDNKFIYPDGWGSIVLRNEAWIRIVNGISLVHSEDYNSFAKDMCKIHIRTDVKHTPVYLDNTWIRFYENIAKGVKTYEQEFE